MREIRHRGKNEGTDEWVFGSLIILPDKTLIARQSGCENPLGEYTYRSYRVIPETVDEYSGLYDSKRTEQYPEGQPIYEGDVVTADLQCYDGVRKLRLAEGAVYFSNGSFKVKDRVAAVRLDDFANDVILEVVGNVHEGDSR